MTYDVGDEKVDFVLDQIETMVASEGGTLEDVLLDGDDLSLSYKPGVNEECPECVPTHKMVEQFLTASLGIHAPNISSIRVNLNFTNMCSGWIRKVRGVIERCFF